MSANGNGITLSKQELEDLKDEIKFREYVSTSLKNMGAQLNTLFSKLEKKEPECKQHASLLEALNVKVNIQWWFIGVISVAIIGFAFKIFQVKL